MKITTIKYLKLSPDGQRAGMVEATAELARGEKPEAALIKLKAFVDKALGLDITQDETAKALEVVRKARKAGLLAGPGYFFPNGPSNPPEYR